MRAPVPTLHEIRLDHHRTNVHRPRHRQAAKFNKGDRYFLVVWPPNGMEARVQLRQEEMWLGSGRVHGALEVKVIDVCDGFVVEETTTWNFPSLKRAGFTRSIDPPGRGWVLLDASHDKFTVWARLRDWKVLG